MFGGAEIAYDDFCGKKYGTIAHHVFIPGSELPVHAVGSVFSWMNASCLR